MRVFPHFLPVRDDVSENSDVRGEGNTDPKMEEEKPEVEERRCEDDREGDVPEGIPKKSRCLASVGWQHFKVEMSKCWGTKFEDGVNLQNATGMASVPHGPKIGIILIGTTCSPLNKQIVDSPTFWTPEPLDLRGAKPSQRQLWTSPASRDPTPKTPGEHLGCGSPPRRALGKSQRTFAFTGGGGNVVVALGDRALARRDPGHCCWRDLCSGEARRKRRVALYNSCGVIASGDRTLARRDPRHRYLREPGGGDTGENRQPFSSCRD
ncbi:hypothetical protein NDU88_007013 [Pleurodeles waltl]|uniref:Uncharacterized protein n=1 Tax=Pleurodeles waltl TaxID=8319 RepID=A0AAV7WF74_PLEWA|nr:hypothetical protein NDU88_007013 [Pleurodeles waltl]